METSKARSYTVFRPHDGPTLSDVVSQYGESLNDGPLKAFRVGFDIFVEDKLCWGYLSWNANGVLATTSLSCLTTVTYASKIVSEYEEGLGVRQYEGAAVSVYD